MADVVAALADSGVLARLVPPADGVGPHPGGVVAVLSAGERAAVGFGVADLGHGVPIGADTVFDSASVAKQFTAAAVAALVDQGRVDQEDPVSAHLPGLGPVFAPVRLRHLLLHTSGVRDYQPMLALAGVRRRDYVGVADVLGLLSRQRSLAHPCGTRHMYSNSNYVLLAEVVARVSGMPFGEFLAEHVLEPAGMTATAVRDDPTRVVPGAACSYRPDGDGYRVEYTPTDIVGDSGLLTTAADLLTWGGRLLGDGPAAKALRAPGHLDDGTPLAYGHGVVFGDWAGEPGFGHAGSFDGFRAQLVVLPGRDLAAVVMANWSGADPAAVLRGVLAHLLRPPAPRPAPPPAPEWPELLLDDAGSPWRLRRGTGGTLVLLAVAAQAVMTPSGEDELRGEYEGAELVLRRADGEHTVDFGGRALSLRPAEAGDPPDPAVFAGSYYSDELGTLAVVTAEDGRLRWRRRSADEELRWVAGGVFHAGATWVVFDRSPDGAAHLEVHTSRATGLRFERR